MITISFIRGRKGTDKLELKIHFKHERKSRYYVFDRVDKEYWDHDNKTLKPSHPKFVELLSKMNKLTTLAQTLWDDMNKFGSPDSAKLMQRIRMKYEFKEIKDSYTIPDFAKKWLSEADVSKGTYTSYEKTIELLAKFSPQATFDDFGYEYADNLLKWLKKRYKNKNTLRKHWVIISVVFKFAYNSGLIQDRDFAIFNGIKVIGQDVKKTFLFPEDIKALIKKDFDDDILNLIRDAFALSFFTSLRKQDILTITSENISIEKNGNIILTITPKKTAGHNREVTYNLTTMFNGDPEKLIFPYMRGEVYFKHLDSNNVYVGLKEISKQMEWKNVQFHTARHSSLTYIAKITGSVFEVMNHGCISNIATAEKYVHFKSKIFKSKLIKW